MIPKTEKELNVYIALQQLIYMDSIIKKGPWHFGSGQAYSSYVSAYEASKIEYLKLANE